MNDERGSVDRLLLALQERAKELGCIFAIEELLRDPDRPLPQIFGDIVKVLPSGWKYPDVCVARIQYEGDIYATPEFRASKWRLESKIVVGDQPVGSIAVHYTQQKPLEDSGPFLKEESRLINTVAERLGHFLQYQRLRQAMVEWKRADQEMPESQKEWRIIVELLRRTDLNLYRRVVRKMIVHLRWNGVPEAAELQNRISLRPDSAVRQMHSDHSVETTADDNRPVERKGAEDEAKMGEEVFQLAAHWLSDAEIQSSVQKWIQEDKSSFLVRMISNRDAQFADIADALRRFRHLASEGLELPSSTHKGIKVDLIRRFFTDELEFINIAKEFLEIDDFYDLMNRTIYPPGSHGKLGGKTSGLFLASRILCKLGNREQEPCKILTPKTWYITSDAVLKFINYNNLEEIVEQKYKEIWQVRSEYEHIVQLLKSARFPPELIRGLSVALDDFENRPVIVRSSSLLEDRREAAFSGKYKSLFLANQGSKAERLEALMDAIAEVYSSMFGPDPIEYRAERGLLDFHEEMGIMIQEVVGRKIDHYFLPAYAGVIFSNNEFRWSPRIRREDGLVRLVPGLGTRAVDRLSDDYPVLIAPGQPNLRVNVTTEEVLRYSPNKMDLINLDTNQFETIEVEPFMKKYGPEIPGFHHLVSVVRDDHLYQPGPLATDFDNEQLVVTFEGLISKSPFIDKILSMTKILQEQLGTPVDLEFASDGVDFYLLQCRAQSYAQDAGPAAIPRNVPSKETLFTAKRFVSNGRLPEITHLVYVDPAQYSEIEDIQTLHEVARAIGELNKLLPKRQFILMGPGRWGSRGDIKLGVSTTYADISNTAMLIEIARKHGNYVPDLSFGTHFFQDLVESSIRYLPLYPDDPGVQFNEHFLLHSHNILSQISPKYAELAQVIHVIDVPRSTDGKIVQVLMNAEQEEAIAIFAAPGGTIEVNADRRHRKQTAKGDEYWRWRLQMAERVANSLKKGQFGVVALYIFGSTKNATAKPESDIDLLVHFNGTAQEKIELERWLEGWSLCLDEMNYLRTGSRSGGLLDVEIITDEDIAARTSYAVKIGAVTDAARPLPLRSE